MIGWQELGDQWRSLSGRSRCYVVRHVAHSRIPKVATMLTVALGDWSGSAGWWSSETAGEQNLLGACGATYCDASSKAISDAQLV